MKRRRPSATRSKFSFCLSDALEPRLLLTAFEVGSFASFNFPGSFSPQAGMTIDAGGNIYGISNIGGSSAYVFKVDAGQSTAHVLASFDGANSSDTSGLVVDSHGNLFGTSLSGGANSKGAIFEIPAGTTNLTSYVSFNGTNGDGPDSLTIDSNDNLYGFTRGGGSAGNGTAFEIDAGTTTIHNWANFDNSSGTGANPHGILRDSSGNLYGGTVLGGTLLFGTVFKVPAGGGPITELFNDFGADTHANGESPNGSMVMDAQGNLYGTTPVGGAHNFGTLFKRTSTGTFSTLFSFTGDTDGGNPYANLLIDSQGNVYGTTSTGGANDAGTVFELRAGDTTPITLVSFDFGEGTPTALAMDSHGSLYGIASSGGQFSGGYIFKVVPTPTHLTIASQPTATVMGRPIIPIVVDLRNDNGDIATFDSSTVSIAVATGPGSLGNTVNEPAVQGVATFDDVAFSAPGTYTLTISSGSLPPIVTAPFVVETANQAFLKRLYNDILHRAPDGGEAIWLNLLDTQQIQPADVATAFTNSTEYRTNRIREQYETILNRDVDQAGLNAWLAFFGAGHTLEEMKVGFYSSDEYFQAHGSDNTALVTAYYHAMLGRAPEESGLAFWGGLLDSGAPRAQVATGIQTNSLEGAGNIVTHIYQTFLGRDPDDSGKTFWISQVQQGSSEITIILGFVSSAEYFQTAI